VRSGRCEGTVAPTPTPALPCERAAGGRMKGMKRHNPTLDLDQNQGCCIMPVTLCATLIPPDCHLPTAESGAACPMRSRRCPSLGRWSTGPCSSVHRGWALAGAAAGAAAVAVGGGARRGMRHAAGPKLFTSCCQTWLCLLLPCTVRACCQQTPHRTCTDWCWPPSVPPSDPGNCTGRGVGARRAAQRQRAGAAIAATRCALPRSSH
jgi:hypothetical protein